MKANSKVVNISKLKSLDYESGASLLEQNGYQLVGQYGYPEQQQSDDLKIYYYSERQFQVWDHQAKPIDNKVHIAVYENINDYIKRESPIREDWSNLVN